MSDERFTAVAAALLSERAGALERLAGQLRSYQAGDLLTSPRLLALFGPLLVDLDNLERNLLRLSAYLPAGRGPKT